MQRFVLAYCASADLNATQAARDAGYKGKESSLHERGCRLLDDPRIQAAIKVEMDARSKRLRITADRVLEHFWDIATADPNELVEYRRVCCRYCWGKNFDYQRTAKEYERDQLEWDSRAHKKAGQTFDEKGGVGFNGQREPNAECPECFGAGLGSMHIKDTRKLSRSARRLYLGVKTTKDGIEVKMNDQVSALINVGKHLGMFNEKDEPPEDEEARARKIRAQLDAMDEVTLGAAA